MSKAAAVPQSEGDLNISTKDTPIVKTYKGLKIAAGIISASLIIFALAGQVYNVPDKIDTHTKDIQTHSVKIEEQGKVLMQQQMDMNSVKKSVDEIKAQQTVSATQMEQMNRSMIELKATVETTMKFNAETMKEMRQDIKDIKSQTR